eukprot:1074648-Amphidinium_carterae.2
MATGAASEVGDHGLQSDGEAVMQCEQDDGAEVADVQVPVHTEELPNGGAIGVLRTSSVASLDAHATLDRHMLDVVQPPMRREME